MLKQNLKKRVGFYTLLLMLVFHIVPVYAVNQSQHQKTDPDKRVAIIIDDFGNNMAGTEEILDLPFSLTIAVMPFLPTTQRDAEWAYQKGHDVIVHLPMEPIRGKKSWLGPGAITKDLSDEEIRKRVEQAIDNVPHAVGMNNHMGSKITADERIMRIVLDVCQKRGLFYMDSKTNPRSVVSKIAKELNVPYIENHIFLDDIWSVPHIAKQCRLIREHLSEHPICLAIGHVGKPGKKTAAVLEQEYRKIEEEAKLVKLSELIEDGKIWIE